ncbi:lysine specific demethylase 8 [Trichuris trichiura]|uniref:Lysine specific demethylase 8 n=1 Tax=Trichuris trichiura TaxID=36087 RepID=A0A077YZF0_TRITR|nr:lysine specific demethylase 8 [Trichuris trichiura]
MGLQEWLLAGQNNEKQWTEELDPAVVSYWVISVLHKAFEALRSKDYLTTQKLCKFLLDIAWEKFNIGHWSEVNICWRQLHTLVTYVQTMYLWAVGSLKEAMQSCDKGLILGAPLRQFSLTTIATEIHAELSAVEPCSLPSKCSSTTRNLDKITIMLYGRNLIIQIGEKVRNFKFCIFTVVDQANFCFGINLRAEVKRIHCPSMTQFDREYLHSVQQKPVVIEGALDCWPAFQKWNLEYFLKLAGHRTVPVEIGTRYTDENWTQQLMPLHQFVASYFGENGSDDVGYLAQYDLFEQIPELRNDIAVPEYCCLVSDPDNVDVNAWFGPKGTVSPLHTDPTDNLFAQVMGVKYICLCPPDDSEMVYPIESGLMRNTSQVDMAGPDFDAFPNLRKARVYETVVHPGDLLFIPRGWWHYLKSMTTSFSVSFWFRPSNEVSAT